MRLCVCFALLAAACSASPVEVALSDVVLRVEPADGRIRVTRPDGSVILDSLAGGSVGKGDDAARRLRLRGRLAAVDRAVRRVSGRRTATPRRQGVRGFHDCQKLPDGISFAIDGPDGGGSGSIRRVADGTLALTMSAPKLGRASAAFSCAPDERFLGFGAMPMDVEHRGATVPLWVSEQGVGRVDSDDYPSDWFLRGTRHQSYFPVPFFVSSRDYGVLADTTERSVFAMCSEADDAWRVEAWEGTMSLHVFYGASPLEVIRRHSDLEGRAPVPPPFAFAPWNDAIFGSANVRAIADELRENHIPSSVIWTEDWAGGISDGAGGYHLPYDVDARSHALSRHRTAGERSARRRLQWLGYFNTFVVQGEPNFAPGRGGRLSRAEGRRLEPYVLDGVPLGKQDALVDLTSDAGAELDGGRAQRRARPRLRRLDGGLRRVAPRRRQARVGRSRRWRCTTSIRAVAEAERRGARRAHRRRRPVDLRALGLHSAASRSRTRSCGAATRRPTSIPATGCRRCCRS